MDLYVGQTFVNKHGYKVVVHGLVGKDSVEVRQYVHKSSVNHKNGMSTSMYFLSTYNISEKNFGFISQMEQNGFKDVTPKQAA